MKPTPPLDARRPTSYAASTASTMPAESEPADAALGLAHSCPHCGKPIAVLNVLIPVDEPPGLEASAGERRG